MMVHIYVQYTNHIQNWLPHILLVRDKCKELKRLRGEFQEAETAAATLEADIVHQEMSNRALVLLDTKRMVGRTCANIDAKWG